MRPSLPVTPTGPPGSPDVGTALPSSSTPLEHNEGKSDSNPKLEFQTPSKVLHVRGLPPGCTRQELAALVSPHVVVRTLLLKKVKQAMMEMVDASAATIIVERFVKCTKIHTHNTHTHTHTHTHTNRERERHAEST
jgi:hypothetical protein